MISPLAAPFLYLSQIKFDVARALGVVNDFVQVQVNPVQSFGAPAFTVGISRIVVNPSFFTLSPWHQFAVMLHEYMHAIGVPGEQLADLMSLTVSRIVYGEMNPATQWFALRVSRRLAIT